MSIGSTRVNFQQLHHLLTHAANLRSEIERAPKTLQMHKDKLAKQEQTLKDYLENSRKAKVHMHEKEGTLKDLNQKIDKWEGQVNSVNTKKEFDALKHEVAAAKAQCKKIEDEILEAMTDIETRTARQPELEKELAAAKTKTAQLIDDIQTRRNEFTTQLAEALTQITALEETMIPDVRAAYNRLKESQGAEALAIVENRTCRACYTTLTAQNYNDLLHGRLVPCKMCGRILYIEPQVAKEGE
jgi:predicted  nucleic acid-binding Zn-ribbon protein